jgi:hypothetical protein
VPLARALTLAENITQRPMDPIDAFEAYGGSDPARGNIVS